MPAHPHNPASTEDEPLEPDAEQAWTIAKSEETYLIKGWGDPYFRINDAGHVEVRASSDADAHAQDLHELVESLQMRGLDLPILIRFSDVLHDRIRLINECFAKAIAEYEYDGVYRGVFPVKVNQQRHFIDEVVVHGQPWRFGLEAGSKPELLIALAANPEPGGLIVCNGYKDRAYIETALLAQRFDKTVLVVLERIEELDVAVQQILVTARIADMSLDVLDGKDTPVAGLILSGALDLSKPGNLVAYMPKRPDVLVDAKDDRVVLDLMKVPKIANNPQARRALEVVTPVLNIAAIRTRDDHLDVHLKASISGIGDAVAAATS